MKKEYRVIVYSPDETILNFTVSESSIETAVSTAMELVHQDRTVNLFRTNGVQLMATISSKTGSEMATHMV